MGRNNQKKSAKTPDRPPIPRWVAPVAILLMVAGVVLSAYLFKLYLAVHAAGGQAVDSFCAVSEELNCVTVANSRYASFLGIPVALYGLEFYGVMLVVTLLSWRGLWRLRRWDSLLLIGTAASVPAIIALAWISAYRIHSLCLLCTGVYAINILLLVMLALVHRRGLGSALAAGPKELGALLARKGWLAGCAVAVVAAMSQLFWVPGILAAEKQDATAPGIWQGMPTSGQTIGPKDAEFVIEEFTDFQCPVCGAAHKVMSEVLRELPGKVHLIHRDFPLGQECNPMIKSRFHPDACRAAHFARCAAVQGKYWPYEALLFENRHNLDEDSLKSFGAQIGLDPEELARCAKSPETRAAIQKDIQEGISRGLRGTPTFFVNGEKIVGIRPISFWRSRLKAKASDPEAPADTPATPR